MVWQTPALSLTAQAFLFTIALGEGTSGARLISALLALVAALASMQLMAKHRYLEIQDAKLLERYEEANDLEPIHARPNDEEAAWYNQLSSYKVWLAMMASFALAAVGIVLVVLYQVVGS
jgi:hypothetical protein